MRFSDFWDLFNNLIMFGKAKFFKFFFKIQLIECCI